MDTIISYIGRAIQVGWQSGHPIWPAVDASHANSSSRRVSHLRVSERSCSLRGRLEVVWTNWSGRSNCLSVSHSTCLEVETIDNELKPSSSKEKTMVLCKQGSAIHSPLLRFLAPALDVTSTLYTQESHESGKSITDSITQSSRYRPITWQRFHQNPTHHSHSKETRTISLHIYEIRIIPPHIPIKPDPQSRPLLTLQILHDIQPDADEHQYRNPLEYFPTDGCLPCC